MAHNQKNEISERRLRPIYDLLDQGNLRKVISESDRLIKKLGASAGESLCAKTLKAIALARLGKIQESETLANEVTKLKPIDEYVLQALTYCFKELSLPERIPPLYEYAVEQMSSESLLTHLFMSYARIRELIKQQQVAMQLFKATNNEKYLVWVILCILMQSQLDAQRAKLTFLPLAEKMLQRIKEQPKEEYFLRGVTLCAIEISENNDQCDVALQILKSSEAAQFIDVKEINRRIFNLLYKSGRWKDLVNECQSILQKNMARSEWHMFKLMIDACVKLRPVEGSSFDVWQCNILRPIELTISQCLAEVSHSNRIDRSSFLGKLYLIYNIPESNFSVIDRLTVLLDYVKYFGSKACCYTDILPYLEEWIIQKKLCIKFANLLNECISDDDIDHFKLVNKFKIRWYLNLTDPDVIKDKYQFVCNLFRRYLNNVPVRAEDVETLPGIWNSSDGYLWLVIEIMWHRLITNVDDNSISFSFVLKLGALILFAVERSPEFWPFRIALIKYFSAFTAGNSAYDIWNSLRLKSMQSDSLNYLLFHSLRLSASTPLLFTIVETQLNYALQAKKETAESITLAYRVCNVCLCSELLAFANNIKKSLSTLAAAAFYNYFACLSSDDEKFIKKNFAKNQLMHFNVAEFDAISLSSIIDNRDFGILDLCDVLSRDKLDRYKQRSAEEDIYWIRIWVLLNKIFNSSFSELFKETASCMINGTNNDLSANDSDNERIAGKLIDNLESLLEEMRKKFCSDYNQEDNLSSYIDLTNILYPPSSKLNLYVAGPYLECILVVLRAVRLCAQDTVTDSQFDDNVLKVEEFIRRMINNHQLLINRTIFFPHRQLSHLMFCAETLLYLSALCKKMGVSLNLQLISNDTLDHQSVGKKKSKAQRHKSQQLNDNNIENKLFLRLAAIIRQAIVSVNRLCDDLKFTVEDSGICSIEHSINELSVDDDKANYLKDFDHILVPYEQKFLDMLKQSYENSLNNISLFLNAS